jgi:hypothetical protein
MRASESAPSRRQLGHYHSLSLSQDCRCHASSDHALAPRRSWLVLTTVAQNGADGQVTVSSSVTDWLMVPMVAGRDR